MTVASRTLTESQIQFGTSGARGLVDQFTDEACAAFTVAFIEVMKNEFAFDRIALGIDRRPSSPGMAQACAAAAEAVGVQVDYYGILPTPALALRALKDKVPAIVITGSHIPFDRNGIKFYRPTGEITKADELAITASSAAVPSITPEALPVDPSASEDYINRYAYLYPNDLLKGKRIGLYEHSAAGRDLNRLVLSSLGAEVISLGRTETFVPIDTEAVSEEDQAQAIAWSNEFSLDAILSTDGDGDRPLVADENGQWLRGDLLGLACSATLGIKALAVPVSCNSAIDLSGLFESVVRTKIGSPYVIAGMESLSKSHDAVAGFEANGGYLLQSDINVNAEQVAALPTRDALLPALMLFAESVKQGKTISECMAGYPQRFTASDRIKEVPTEKSKALLVEWANDLSTAQAQLELSDDVVDANTVDGLRMTLANGDIVHLRPSGNAPELRCYAESGSEEVAKTLVLQSLQKVAAIIR